MAILSPWRGRIIAKGDSPASVASVPNLICIARILLTPVFVWLLLADNGELGDLRVAAAIFFIVLLVTDSLDGWIARSRNLVTDFGKLIDPIADKAITGAAFVGLSILGELDWWITIIVLVREVAITVHRLTVAQDVVIPASWAGKAKTIAQAVALSLALLPLSLLVGEWIVVVNIAVMSIAVALTVFSGLEYVWQIRKARRAK
ncbi:CDP-diacylglycerol--glycerol-3-phosphate 3-phosphatidyltransferase [Humidisolicoccus flavus]|uniref:CDP-diacylglycerol--glycerol-3-phosphate 3-phosphatidyltransferase n=1 Tax=Humidisolicoccus flavus TaxID=3111414 RepID=UPI00324C960B